MKMKITAVLIFSMMLTTMIAACGTDNRAAGEAGRFPSELTARKDILKEGVRLSDKLEEELLAPVQEVEAQETLVPDEQALEDPQQDLPVQDTVTQDAEAYGPYHHGTHHRHGGMGHHAHTWVACEGSGHYVTQTVEEAWDEQVYEDRIVCGCGRQFCTVDECMNHQAADNCTLDYCRQRVHTGTIHHDAVTSDVWVEDVPAYSVCSICGARQ